MKRQIGRVCAVILAALFLSITVMELNADARVGGSRSMGSRGSRTYTRPASPVTQPSQQRQQQAAPAPGQVQQPQAGGGFLRSMAGGLMGGMLGSMLFSSFAGAGTGGMGGGGGIGLFPILLLAGAGYFLYRFIQRRRAETMRSTTEFQGNSKFDAPRAEPHAEQSYETAGTDTDTGLTHIRQMDPGFSEAAFNDTVMDRFFKIQAAWMNRDLSSVSGMLTEEMRQIFQGDVDQLLRERRVNRLENIAVRKVEIVEAWQESGQDYITALIHANLLDYTTDESSGAVVEGSKTEPVRFEEYWTFTRPVGNGSWQLSAIHQK